MMAHMDSTPVVQLFRFMRLFGTTMFSILETEDEYVRALIAWEDGCQGGIPDPEETQEIQWLCRAASVLDDALAVGEYAYDAGWIHSDQFQVDRDAIAHALSWGRDRVDRAIADLLSISVDMVDDGEVMDRFQLHL